MRLCETLWAEHYLDSTTKISAFLFALLLLCCFYADQSQTRAQRSCAELSCRRCGARSHAAFLVLDLKGRTLLRPPAAAVIHPRGRDIRMAQPLLHLGNVRPMG